MRIVSFQNGEPGFFAFAPYATGVIAIGQVAVGFIAIGQLAIGGIAAGQLGFGLMGAGQLGLGVYAAGGLGIGGRGKGAIGKLVPTVDPPRSLPPTTTLDSIRAGWGDGWLAATLGWTKDQLPGLYVDGQPLPLKISKGVLDAAFAELGLRAESEVQAHVRRVGDVLICDRLMHVPIPMTAQRDFYSLLVVRMVLLIAMAAAWWVLVAPELAKIVRALF